MSDDIIHFYRVVSNLRPRLNRKAMNLASQMISKSASKNWKEMGVLSLTLYGYSRPNGTLVVEM